MAEGLGHRMACLRAARGASVRELSERTGIARHELLALENGSGRSLSPETLRRLADFFTTTTEYLENGVEPAPEVLRAGFFRLYDAMAPEERQSLKFAPIQTRLETALRFLEGSYPTLLDRTQVAARLGYSPEALADVLRGTATLQSRLLKLTAAMIGIDMGFFIRGDFFGGAMATDQEITPARLSEYYRVVQEAIAAGISPGALRKAVQILSVRDQEE